MNSGTTGNTLWLYWEFPKGAAELPPYIDLCRQIMEYRNGQGFRLQLVTPENLNDFLPSLDPRLWQIERPARGRLERYFGRRLRRQRAIAQRADYIRAFLLERYGGIYIDSDAIVLRDLGPFFERLKSADFLITRRSSHGKTHVSIGFYGSQQGGDIITEYCDQLRRRLAGPRSHSWNEVGSEMLTPIVDRSSAQVVVVDEDEVQPITWETANDDFANTTLQPDQVLKPQSRIFMLYSGPFMETGPLYGLGAEELLHGQALVSRMFRRGFDMDVDNSDMPTSNQG